MYKIDRINNNIIKLEPRLFSELQIKERQNLQEWIAKNPGILDDLLIIQKEFAGFNDTSERLDLLALDRDGTLVIIENKLDYTGKDVVWQALKYTSYCSTLTTQQIVHIYQQYLDGSSKGENAKENILEFLDTDEENLLLNRNDQRIILVANNYRKEVTSTVLWLLNHGITIQCFRAIPYSMGEELFLQVEQIIPLPETKEFMIDMIEKEKEDKIKSKAVSETEGELVEFWKLLKNKLEDNKISLLDNVSAKPYYSIGTLDGRARFAFCIGRTGYRVEMYFSSDENKELIEAMMEYKQQIDDQFSLGKIEWEKLDNKKASRIKFEKKGSEITGNDDPWKNLDKLPIVDWYVKAMNEFYDVMHPIWRAVDIKTKR
jgi:hypothetical protein